MSFEKSWYKALKSTEIIRSRIQALLTLGDTHVPYILLSESTINVGDTIVRKGEVVVEKPSIIVPPNHPQFQGFEFGEEERIDENSLINFLLVRGVRMPSLRYDNKTMSLDIHEGKLSGAIKHYENILQKEENVQTGLIKGPEDCWQFSLLIFICTQVARNADQDIKRLLEEFKKQEGNNN